MKTILTDKHERIREAYQAANAFGKDSYVMVISSDLGALLSERDALRGAIEAAMACGMIPKSSTQDGGASGYSRQVQVADMIRAALAQGEV